jgi:trigger factor
VKSTIEALEGNLVKLSVEVAEDEFDRNIDAAFRKIAREVRLPGFRPGKAPRKVLEARIGLDAARAQAIEDAIPEYLTKAVREHDVDLIATPDVTLTGGQTDGVVSFDATCQVRPEIDLPGYESLRVELVNPRLSDEELDEAVAAEVRRHGRLADVDRPAANGDTVVIDLAGTREGEPVPGLNVDEWTYEVGKGWIAPGFDDQLTGAKKGDTLRFSAVPNGTEQEADFEVSIVKVQELVLPEVTDEWVAETIAEADTVAEWRDTLRARHEESRTAQMRQIVVDRLTDALAEMVTVEIPEAMVAGDLQARTQNMIQQMQSQGISIEQWLQITGQDPESFIAALKVQSEKAVRVDLALRAVAKARAIEITDDDLEDEYSAIAVRVGEKSSKVRKLYEQNDGVGDLVASMRKQKALDWLVHNAAYVDQDGNALDTDMVLGHDHDHDHDDDESNESPEAAQ